MTKYAFYEAARLNHPVYDMFYIILARRNACPLLTVDEKLKKIANDLGLDVI